MKLRITVNLPWSQWTAEIENEIYRLVRDLGLDFAKRPRWVQVKDDRFRATAFISARSGREGEEMRREALRLARERGLPVRVEF